MEDFLKRTLAEGDNVLFNSGSTSFRLAVVDKINEKMVRIVYGKTKKRAYRYPSDLVRVDKNELMIYLLKKD